MVCRFRWGSFRGIMGVAFEHVFEIDQVFLGFFFIFFLLLSLLHEAEHFVFTALVGFLLEVHDGLLLIQRTHTADTSSFSPIKMSIIRKVAYLTSSVSLGSDVLPFHLGDRRCAAGPWVPFLRIFSRKRGRGLCRGSARGSLCWEYRWCASAHSCSWLQCGKITSPWKLQYWQPVCNSLEVTSITCRPGFFLRTYSVVFASSLASAIVVEAKMVGFGG